LRGDDRADACLVEQLRRKCLDVSEDLAFELGGLAGRRFDPSGEAAEHLPCGELVGWS
jgi:hypothetical protein